MVILHRWIERPTLEGIVPVCYCKMRSGGAEMPILLQAHVGSYLRCTGAPQVGLEPSRAVATALLLHSPLRRDLPADRRGRKAPALLLVLDLRHQPGGEVDARHRVAPGPANEPAARHNHADAHSADSRPSSRLQTKEAVAASASSSLPLRLHRRLSSPKSCMPRPRGAGGSESGNASESEMAESGPEALALQCCPLAYVAMAA
jgi:hypothetical protein